MALDCLQRTLETIYRIDGPVPVCDYRIDGNCLEILLGAGATSRQRESLIVHRDDEYTNLALYVADSVVLRARTFRGLRFRSTSARSARRLLRCDEGVSHFVYFTFCGVASRPRFTYRARASGRGRQVLVLGVLRPVGLAATLERFDAFALAPVVRGQERYMAANGAATLARWLRVVERGR